MGLTGYENLEVWQKSLDLAADVYGVLKTYPKYEMFGLCDQMRRSAVSICSNIAEGASRNSKKEFIQFVYVALGSLSEIETQIHLSKKVGYLDDSSHFLNLTHSIKRMLHSLIASLRK